MSGFRERLISHRALLCCVALFLFVLIRTSTGKRYRYCSDGCCPHEFCAFHTICYPHMSCSLGCPDGACSEGVCLPHRPCKDSVSCPMAHDCTYNYNLGYKSCQYNLDIGLTTCVDRDGNPLLKTLS